MPHEKISFRALNIATERCGAVLSDEKVLQREKVLQDLKKGSMICLKEEEASQLLPFFI